jgi:hypothetical protein
MVWPVLLLAIDIAILYHKTMVALNVSLSILETDGANLEHRLNIFSYGYFIRHKSLSIPGVRISS